MAINAPRNPGPSWGFRAIHWWDTHLPAPLRDAAVSLGGAVAYGVMPTERAASHEYLATLWQRPAKRRESMRHFAEFTHSLLAKLRSNQPGKVTIDWRDEANRQRGQLMYADEPIMLGTFHVGASDLMGFHIKHIGRRATMIRQRVENSEDINRLLNQAGGMIEIIWVNDESEIIFALKDALEAGKSIAMQCDRIDHASKLEAFHFLGARRLFPVTIYRLAAIYQRPVQFCVALPRDGSRDQFDVYASEGYRPGANRRDDQPAAHEHFQGVLNWLEDLLKAQPYQWFNFLPLNPSPAEPHARI